MGVRNLRAICPNCGGKIHTQPKGLGHLTWANSWFLVQTGTSCQHCEVALSGKVGAGNKAILATHADKPWSKRHPGPRASRPTESAAGEAVMIMFGAVPPKQKIRAIKAVRDTTNLSLRAAKTLVDNAPSEVTVRSKEAADRLVAELEGIGVGVERPQSAAGQAPSGHNVEANDPTEMLRKLGELRGAGVLTEEEFASKKAELLDRL